MTVLRTVAATLRYWFDMACAKVLDALDTTPAHFGPTNYLAEYEAWLAGSQDRKVIADMEAQFAGGDCE